MASQPFSNPPSPVYLESNALYICTVPLMAAKFHWSLIHVDQNGRASYHHWAAFTNDQRGPEAYIEQSSPGLPLHSKHDGGPRAFAVKKSQILGFFKVNVAAIGYKLDIEMDRFRGICSRVFPQSFPTVDENRAHDVNCRTWVRGVLVALGMSHEHAMAIEHAVTARSEDREKLYLTCFLFNRQYQMVVEDVRFNHIGIHSKLDL